MSTPTLFILDQGATDKNPLKPSGRIFTCNFDGTSPRDLVTDLQHYPDGITLSPTHKYIFWTNMGEPTSSGWTNAGSIQRCDLDGSNIITVFEAGTVTHTPKQLVIAEKARKLYWCDREGMRVMRSDLDGKHPETLISYGNAALKEHRDDYERWCVGISVDEYNNYVYWTMKGPPKGGKGRILRMPLEITDKNVSAQDHVEVLFEKLPEPIDLELDLKHGLIFWTDRGDEKAKGNSVNRSKIPAKNEKVSHDVLVENLHEGIGLALDEKSGKMFYTDIKGGVYGANVDGSEECTLYTDLGTLTGIAAAWI